MPSLKLLVIRSPQLERVRNFYEALGFGFASEQHGKGPVHYAAAMDEGIFEIYPLPNDTQVDKTIRLGFAVTDLEQAILAVESTAEVMSRPKLTPWGTRALLKDPDGRVVELYQAQEN